MSVIVRVEALDRRDAWKLIDSSEAGDIYSRDESLVVLGPLFDAEPSMARLAALGLAYFDDYFDLPNSGGTVPEWCEVTLTMRDR